MLDTCGLDTDLRARDGRESDERTDLDVIGPDAMRATPDRPTAVNGDRIGSDPIDLRAEGAEEMREVLDVRLAGRVAQDRRPTRRSRGDQRVFGSCNAWLVEKNVRANQGLRAKLERVVGLDHRAKPLECEKVRVEPATPNDVTTWRRKRDLATAREQRSRKQNGC